jgi:hypothetical protein
VTPKLTWTFGLRDTFNSNPLNPHNQIARLHGAFDSISHDLKSTAERRDSDRRAQSTLLNSAGHPATANRARVATRTELAAPRWLRSFQ